MSGPGDEAYVAALAGLPEMTPRRLATLLRGRSPAEAWDRASRGWVPTSLRPSEGRGGAASLADRWRSEGAAASPDRVMERLAVAGVRVLLPGPAGLADRLAGLDPPVSILFALGRHDALDHPCVALVGTRRATALGREVARSFGADLAAAGVVVGSGLAFGVDAAAHAGALDVPGGAPPLGVVGTGLDVPYPRSHQALWDRMADRGLLLSEHPLGVGAEPHHFPQRNRVLAALAGVTVVVESHRSGGSLITARLALDLGRTVAAVPGSLRNPAAEGANALLRDGAVPVLDALDVRVAAGLATDRSAPGGAPDPSAASEAGAGLDAGEQMVLDVIGEGATVDELVGRSRAPLAAVVGALDRLDERGVVAPDGAVWRRRVPNGRWA